MNKKLAAGALAILLTFSSVGVTTFAETTTTSTTTSTSSNVKAASSAEQEVAAFMKLYPNIGKSITVLGFQDAYLMSAQGAYLKIRNSSLKITTGWYAVPIVDEDDNGAVRDFEICYVKNSNLEVATGFNKIDGKPYYFSSEGIMSMGWFTTGGYVYYANEKTGVVQTGLTKISGVGYLFDNKGRACCGLYKYKTKYYYFDKTGVCTIETTVEDFEANKTTKYKTIADDTVYYCSPSNIKRTSAKSTASTSSSTSTSSSSSAKLTGSYLETLMSKSETDTFTFTSWQTSNVNNQAKIKGTGVAKHKYAALVVNHDYNTGEIDYYDYTLIGTGTANNKGALTISGVLYKGIRYAKPEYIIVDLTDSAIVYSSGIENIKKLNTLSSAKVSGILKTGNYGLRYGITSDMNSMYLHLTDAKNSGERYTVNLKFYDANGEVLKERKQTGLFKTCGTAYVSMNFGDKIADATKVVITFNDEEFTINL